MVSKQYFQAHSLACLLHGNRHLAALLLTYAVDDSDKLFGHVWVALVDEIRDEVRGHSGPKCLSQCGGELGAISREGPPLKLEGRAVGAPNTQIHSVPNFGSTLRS